MPRNAIEQVREDRNAALIDAMVLAASADGQLQQAELRAVIQRIIERPEFDGVKANEVASLVEASAKRLSHARALEDILHGLRARLPDHRTRLLAFGLATSVVLADRRAQRDELGLLKTMQATLGITEDEVSRVFETVEQGGSLAEALGEPLERLYAEAMVLVSAADGEVQPAELRRMLEELAGDPVFKDVSLEAADGYLRDAAQNLALEGVPQRLMELARGLTTHRQRIRAFHLAVRVAYAAGKPTKDALVALELLQVTFGLGDDEVARITAEA